MAGGKERICFSIHWEISQAAQPETSAQGVWQSLTVEGASQDRCHIPHLISREKSCPAIGSTAFWALGLCCCAVSGRALLPHTLLSPLRATILTAVSAPVSIWLLGCCYTRSAAGAAVMHSCACCGCRSFQAALRCHTRIHQGARGRENMLMVIQNIFPAQRWLWLGDSLNQRWGLHI